jgi:hypothetical protein
MLLALSSQWQAPHLQAPKDKELPKLPNVPPGTLSTSDLKEVKGSREQNLFIIT